MVRSICLVLAAVLGLAGLAGCAAEPNPAVPPEARQVVKGGKSILFTAPHDGRVYLRDETDRRMVYSTDVRRGQIVGFDSSEDRVTVNGKPTGEPVPDAGHRHSIFFEPSDREDLVDRAGNGR